MLLTALIASLALAGAPTPSVLKLHRPTEGEWMGVYLLGKKAGYSFSKISLEHGKPESRLIALEDTTLRATVGTKTVSRRIMETKTYAAKPGGTLLSLATLFEGDGGDYTLVATFDAKGTHLVRTPKGGVSEKIELPAVREPVEAADLARWVAATKETQVVESFDSYELKTKHKVATYAGPTELVAGGARAKAEKVNITEDDEQIAESWAIDPRTGKVLESHFGGALVALPEPEALAKQLDTVDMFALTRVPVDRPLPTGVVTATVTYEVTGFPSGMRPESNRQTYRDLPSGAVELTVRAQAPRAQAVRPATAATPELIEALAATPDVESAAPEIVQLEKKIVGDERDAFTAAVRLSQWVFGHVTSAYGVSSDRATDVLKHGEGDCTEHALLFTALARAAGIPAREVYGLVYAQGTDGVPGLLWHEWAEIYIGEWVAIDPTFGQPVADATHLLLGRGKQKDAVGVMGQLKIHVAAIDLAGDTHGDRPGLGIQQSAKGARKETYVR